MKVTVDGVAIRIPRSGGVEIASGIDAVRSHQRGMIVVIRRCAICGLCRRNECNPSQVEEALAYVRFCPRCKRGEQTDRVELLHAALLIERDRLNWLIAKSLCMEFDNLIDRLLKPPQYAPQWGDVDGMNRLVLPNGTSYEVQRLAKTLGTDWRLGDSGHLEVNLPPVPDQILREAAHLCTPWADEPAFPRLFGKDRAHWDVVSMLWRTSQISADHAQHVKTFDGSE